MLLRIISLIVLSIIVNAPWTAFGASERPDKYPTHSITFFVGSRVGGSADTLARELGAAVTERLGQRVVVVNRGGGGSRLAASQIKIAQPDGYTIGFTSSFAHTYDLTAGLVTYKFEDFEYLATIAQLIDVLVSRSSAPFDDFQSFISYARKKEYTTYASVFPIDRSIMRLVAEKAGVEIIPVPMRGGSEARWALFGSHVDLALLSGYYYDDHVSGQAKILLSLSNVKPMGFPQTATLYELGYDVELLNLLVVIAPRNLPEEIIRSLTEAILQACKSASFRKLVEFRMRALHACWGAEKTDAKLRKQNESFRKLKAVNQEEGG